MDQSGLGYISDGAYFGAINTQLGTGQINQLPTFTWTRWTTKELFRPGQTHATWEGGIACAPLSGVVANYWNTQVVFTADSADPGGYTWKVDQPPASSSSVWPWLALGALVVVVAAFVVMVIRRRRTTTVATGAAHDDDPSGSQRQLSETHQ